MIEQLDIIHFDNIKFEMTVKSNLPKSKPHVVKVDTTKGHSCDCNGFIYRRSCKHVTFVDTIFPYDIFQ